MLRVQTRIWFTLAAMVLLFPSVVAAQGDEGWKTEFNTGSAAFQQGDFARAEQAFSGVVRAVPNFAEGHLNLGLAEERLGNYQQAAEELQTALKLKPNLRGASLFLGISLYNEGRNEEAKAALKRELAADPRNPQAMEYLGLAELALGENAAAAATLDKAAELDPKNINILYFAGHAHTLASNEAYDKMYRIDPNSWRVHQVLAQAYGESSRDEEAIAEYNEAIRLAPPREHQLHYWLGSEYAKMNSIPKAVEAYQQELAISPNDYQCMYSLGLLQAQGSDPAGGVELLKRALAGDPSLKAAYFYMGVGEKNLGQNEAAVEALNTATQSDIDPDLKQRAYYLLGQVYRTLKRPQESQAALAQFAAMKASADQANSLKLSERLKKHQETKSLDASTGTAAQDSNPQP